jgi:hypothetical protein
MTFYISLVPGSEVMQIENYGPGESGPEGSINFTVQLRTSRTKGARASSPARAARNKPRELTGLVR